MDHSKTRLPAITLAALGVVYGDIGTSPLYAMKEVFSAKHGIALNPANVLGAVSLIIWSLIIIVSLKYVALILRADNRGEGGIMALMALALASVTKQSRWYFPLMVVGLAGTSLFFGDGVITPAITILSAIEGLEVATPALVPYVVPAACAVVIGLYSVQRRGTAGLGRWFGVFMLAWFGALAGMGVVNIAAHPGVLAAFDPRYGLAFFVNNQWLGFVALGAIFLALTGAEALYADLGHFGKKPVRLAWFGAVFPALVLNYLGQAAVLLNNPAAADNPFYYQLGQWSIVPLVALSTIAAVIAAQATISATFSVVQSAISLSFLPRMKVLYTSDKEIGQVYIPLANWLQLAIVLLAVTGFGSSDNLAAAYGIAVTITMLTTTILTFFVIRYQWRYNLLLCWAATGFFLAIDTAFFVANSLKIAHGGWFPLVMGAVMMTVMLVWRTGRKAVFDNLQQHAIPLGAFLESLFVSPPLRVPGTAVYFRAEGDGVPHALLHNLLHNKVLHEQTVFLTVMNRDIPTVPRDQRIELSDLGHQCLQLNIHYGFKDDRDIIGALEQAGSMGLHWELMETSFFIARQTVIPVAGGRIPAIWEGVFAAMSRNARDAAEYYKVPANRVIELGTQVEI
ncbi:potassium transporter Kup [Pseudoduganella ginsengisoli]|uniref:Probable potassium transport system protein Kup n=1 Tax=Pseudoduganella ginsengisoli TaxID=1462440 RepID=A0A6L6Q3C9_9BURK|nr:potassium transporter Kup [Pseudoduganella ginsengisoli]MTW03996.1 potassium transporter Kup [Pseudoduganella ginsengisoli]